MADGASLVLMALTILAFALTSSTFAFFFRYKRNFWFLLIFGSYAVSMGARLISRMIGEPLLMLVGVTIDIYTLIITIYVFYSKVKLVDGEIVTYRGKKGEKASPN